MSERPFPNDKSAGREKVRGYQSVDAPPLKNQVPPATSLGQGSGSDAPECSKPEPSAGAVGLWEWDIRTDTVCYSAGWKRRLGYREEEIGNSPREWLDRVHPDDLAGIQAGLKKCLEEAGGECEGEFRIRHKDGSYLNVLAHAAVHRGPDGNPERLFGCHVNVTERRRTEEALRESEEKYRFLVETTNEWIWACDVAGTITYSNPATEATLGYPVEEITGHDGLALLHDADRELVGKQLRRFAAQKRGWMSLVTRWRHLDGTYRYLESSGVPIVDAAGEVVGFRGSARDITDRKRFEEAQARLVAILEATSDFVAISDIRGNAVYVNRAGRALLKVPRDEDLSNTRVRDYCPQWAVDVIVNEAIPAAIRDGVWSGETALLTRDGRQIPISQVIIGHRSPSGEVQYLSTIGRDISERKRLEEELRQSQKLEAIGRLAGGVAHDFNNLLTAIIGYSQLLLSSLGKESVHYRMAEEINRAGERAATLTSQLLAFSRRQVLQPKILNLNVVIAEVENMLRRLIGEDIDLITVLDPAIDSVTADPARVEQVILNLAVNARDAMPDGGTLTISTANVTLNQAAPAASDSIPPAHYVVLSVADTGFGMNKDTQARIFEPFFTTKEMGRGTGLGLSTVYGIVRQSEGYITVQSEPDIGTIFQLYLPSVIGDGEAASAARTEHDAPRGTETVLLVEDELQVRGLAAGVLREQGYTVLEANNGEEALRLYVESEQTIHLLITDVIMPRMGGRELARRLCASRPEMRVLYISGYTEDPAFQRGGLGGTAFLPKPFTPSELAQRAREVLES
jgi:PAS domain S-box-containing protein